MKTIFLFVCFVVQGCIQMLSAQTLTIEVHDAAKTESNLYVAFYSSSEDFLKKPLTGLCVAVTDTLLIIPCQGLPKGEYAFSLFQDENNNGRLDTAAFGIPTEKYAFSNNAEGVMGPPSYEDCRFRLQKDTTVIVYLH